MPPPSLQVSSCGSPRLALACLLWRPNNRSSFSGWLAWPHRNHIDSSSSRSFITRVVPPTYARTCSSSASFFPSFTSTRAHWTRLFFLLFEITFFYALIFLFFLHYVCPSNVPPKCQRTDPLRFVLFLKLYMISYMQSYVFVLLFVVTRLFCLSSMLPSRPQKKIRSMVRFLLLFDQLWYCIQIQTPFVLSTAASPFR